MKRKIKVGDYITFTAATRWSGASTRRKVVLIDHRGRPCVRFGGWPDFIVYHHEITKVEAS